MKTSTLHVIGNKPGKSKVDKANKFQVPIITYNSLVSLITGSITWGKL
jgi:BRCT domain type II-containing protein